MMTKQTNKKNKYFLGAVLIWWMKYLMNIVGNLDVSFYTAAGLARGVSRGDNGGNHHP